MIELINRGKEKNLLCRIPNNLCSHPALKKVEKNSALLRCRLGRLTPSHEDSVGRGMKANCSGEAQHSPPSQVTKVSINNDQSC